MHALTRSSSRYPSPGRERSCSTPAAYIGVIGSKRRWETSADQLLEAGVPEEKIRRVVSPIGLELGAESPEEIALSIMAEIVMHCRGGTGEPMAHSAKAKRTAGKS